MIVPWWAWVLWIAAGVVLEMLAIFNRADGDTLSERVWWICRHDSLGQFVVFVGGGFLLWLPWHFFKPRILELWRALLGGL